MVDFLKHNHCWLNLKVSFYDFSKSWQHPHADIQGQSWLTGQIEPGAAMRDNLSRATGVSDTQVRTGHQEDGWKS